MARSKLTPLRFEFTTFTGATKQLAEHIPIPLVVSHSDILYESATVNCMFPKIALWVVFMLLCFYTLILRTLYALCFIFHLYFIPILRCNSVRIEIKGYILTFTYFYDFMSFLKHYAALYRRQLWEMRWRVPQYLPGQYHWEISLKSLWKSPSLFNLCCSFVMIDRNVGFGLNNASTFDGRLPVPSDRAQRQCPPVLLSRWCHYCFGIINI